MPHADQLTLELVKAVLTALFLTAGALLTTLYWSGWQKRREQQLATAAEFYKCYGDFYSMWKQWNFIADEECRLTEEEKQTRKELLRKSSESEGKLEAILLRVA